MCGLDLTDFCLLGLFTLPLPNRDRGSLNLENDLSTTVTDATAGSATHKENVIPLEKVTKDLLCCSGAAWKQGSTLWESHMRGISDWEPLYFDVYGKRFGDPSRKGKSRFIGTSACMHGKCFKQKDS
jgi:hypothetical protein